VSLLAKDMLMEEKQDKNSEDFEEGNRKRVYQAIFLSLLL